jgi:YbgC/YbaW family acyl-CoA thioester hydrolase
MAARKFEHQWQVRMVDSDASGFAHFSSYFKMMEETEYAFLRSCGLSVVLHDQRGTIGFPRISAELFLENPLRLGELTTIQLSLSEMDGKQITYEFVIHTEQLQLAARGRFVVACCRFPDNQPPYAILIPQFVVDSLMGCV